MWAGKALGSTGAGPPGRMMAAGRLQAALRQGWASRHVSAAPGPRSSKSGFVDGEPRISAGALGPRSPLVSLEVGFCVPTGTRVPVKVLPGAAAGVTLGIRAAGQRKPLLLVGTQISYSHCTGNSHQRLSPGCGAVWGARAHACTVPTCVPSGVSRLPPQEPAEHPWPQRPAGVAVRVEGGQRHSGVAVLGTGRALLVPRKS